MTEPLPTTWRCPICGPVDQATVYKVPSPVDTVFNHRVIGPYGTPTGTRHTVSKVQRYGGVW